MKIGGLEKFSMIDYPEKLSAVVFTIGCTFRCPFCYNPLLVEYSSPLHGSREKGEDHTLSEDGLFLFLESRKGKLDAVVITGGEPTMQPDLFDFIKKIKSMGFLIKLDTNGSNPEVLEKILDSGNVDYVAMDIKADEENYSRATGGRSDLDKVKESVKIIKESGIDYEFRTTCVPGFVDEKIMENMGRMIEGSSKWYLQNFRSNNDLLDKSLVGKSGFTEKQMSRFAEIGKSFVKTCKAR